jgi:hypothetical protein
MTATTKDAFGDRSTAGKVADRVPALTLGGAALLAGRQKLRRKWIDLRRSARATSANAGKAAAGAVKGSAGDVVRAALMGFQAGPGVLRKTRLVRALVGGGALAGEITVADAVFSELCFAGSDSLAFAPAQSARSLAPRRSRAVRI